MIRRERSNHRPFAPHEVAGLAFAEGAPEASSSVWKFFGGMAAVIFVALIAVCALYLVFGWLGLDELVVPAISASAIVLGIKFKLHRLLLGVIVFFTPPPPLLWLGHVLNYISTPAHTPASISWPAAGLERPPRFALAA